MNDNTALTPEIKADIDSLSIYDLLFANRFAPCGDIRFQGERGAYWLERMGKLRRQDEGAYVRVSKDMGWG